VNRITNFLHVRECKPLSALIHPSLMLAGVLVALPLGVGHSLNGSILFGLLLSALAVSGFVLWSWIVQTPIEVLEGLGAGLAVSIGVTSLASGAALWFELPAPLAMLATPFGAICVIALTRNLRIKLASDSFEPGHLVTLLGVSVVALTPFVALLMPAGIVLVVWILGSRAWAEKPRFHMGAHMAAVVVALVGNRLVLEAVGQPPLWLATADQDIVIDEAVGTGLTIGGLDSHIGLLGERVQGHFGLSLWQAAANFMASGEKFLFAGISGSIALTFCLVLLLHSATTALGGNFRLGLLGACIATVTALPGYTPLFVFHNLRGTNLFSTVLFALGILLLVRHLERQSFRSSTALVLVAMLSMLSKAHAGLLLIGIVTLSLLVRSIRLRSPAPLLTTLAVLVGSAFVWNQFTYGRPAGTALQMAGAGLAGWGIGDRETVVALSALALKGCVIAIFTRTTLRAETLSLTIVVPAALFVWWLLSGASSSDYLIHYAFLAVASLIALSAANPQPEISRWPFVVAGLGGFAVTLVHLYLSGSARYRPSEWAFARLSYWRPEALALVVIAVAVMLGFAVLNPSVRHRGRIGALLVIGTSVAFSAGAFVGHTAKPVVHGILFDRWDVNQPTLTEHHLSVGAWLSENTNELDVIATNELCLAELKAGDSTVGTEACSGTSTVLWWISGLSGRQVLIEGPEFGPLAFGAPYSARHAEHHNASRAFAREPTVGSAIRLRTLGVRWYVRNSSHASDGPLDDRVLSAFTSGPYSVIDLENIGS